MKETIEEAILRSRTLIGVLQRAFEHADTKWLQNFLNGNKTESPINYFETVHLFTTFGQSILIELIANKENTPNFYQIFQKTTELTHNSFMLFMVMSENTCETNP